MAENIPLAYRQALEALQARLLELNQDQEESQDATNAPQTVESAKTGPEDGRGMKQESKVEGFPVYETGSNREGGRLSGLT